MTMNKIRIAIAALSLFTVVGGANAAMMTHVGKMKPHIVTMSKSHKSMVHCEKAKHCPVNKTVHVIKASTKK
jgi:hypothetical protein